jgi:hypothetical protein
MFEVGKRYELELSDRGFAVRVEYVDLRANVLLFKDERGFVFIVPHYIVAYREL